MLNDAPQLDASRTSPPPQGEPQATVGRPGGCLRHVVLFRQRADVEKDEALEQSLFDRMVALGDQIPAIQGWRMVKNELHRPPITWGYLLEADVADAQALDAYLQHPLHQAIIKDLKPYMEWAAVDYTV